MPQHTQPLRPLSPVVGLPPSAPHSAVHQSGETTEQKEDTAAESEAGAHGGDEKVESSSHLNPPHDGANDDGDVS